MRNALFSIAVLVSSMAFGDERLEAKMREINSILRIYATADVNQNAETPIQMSLAQVSNALGIPFGKDIRLEIYMTCADTLTLKCISIAAIRSGK